LVAFAAAILLVAAFGVGLAYRYYDNGTNTQTRTPSVLSTSDYDSSLGLRLTLSIGRSSILRSDGITANISLNNTFPTRNNLTISGKGLDIQLGLGPCGQLPLGVEIFQGNYAAGNVSQGKPLDISDRGVHLCPAGFDIAYFSFTPLSDNITLVSPQPNKSGNATVPTDMYTKRASASAEYWGFWTGWNTYPSANVSFQSFPRGVYTIVGEDFWGQSVLLHFRVVDDQNPLDCPAIASNSSFVGHTNFLPIAGPLKLEGYYQNLRSNNTVVLALSNTGHSTVTLLSLSAHYGEYNFSPDGNQIGSWHYYAANGTLSYPAVFFPNECALISITSSPPFPQLPLTLSFADNRTQTLIITVK
jgi:hypothetical protein